jgi:circadian clock protein KaiC
MEVPELLGATTLTGRGLSSIADNIILLRYVEIGSYLTRAISVLKVRGSPHQRVLRELEIHTDSIRIGEPFRQYRGVLTGVPTPAETTEMPSGEAGPKTRRAETAPKPEGQK